MYILEKAMKIVKENEAFYYKDEIIDNTPYRIFNYRLASFTDFSNEPFSTELRGLTINLKTGEYFTGLHKFFNDKENPWTMNDELWENAKLEVREKLDGSLIHCIINNKKIYTKTKGTFNSEQAKIAQEIVDKNENYQKFILDLYNKELYPYFELISPFNQIVVKYPKTELKIIQIRKKNGNYLSYDKLKNLGEKYNLPLINVEYLSLDELRKKQKESKGVEGWVAINWKEPFYYLRFRKFKTDWYFTLHHLISPNNLVENKLIEHILKETIDDILSQLNKDSEKRKIIEEIRFLVSHYFDKELKKLCKIIKEKEQTERKEFALKYKSEKYFGVLMKAKKCNELETLLKERIIKDTKKLQQARVFIKELKEE